MIAFQPTHFRLSFLAIALVSTAALAVAAYLQHALGQRPCPLCIAQRYAFILMAVGGFLGAAFTSVTAVRRGIALLLVTACAGGLYFAVRMVFFTTEASGCGTDAIAIFINDLAIAQWLPQFFFANGGCTDQYPPFFGLAVPMWSLLLFFGLIDIAVLLLVARDAASATLPRWPDGHHYRK